MGSGTILVVDDSPLTIEALRRGLEADGHTVRTASDLADIPRPLRAAGIEVVLMDVVMAEAYGDDVAQVLREDDPGPSIYLLSALEEVELAERASPCGRSSRRAASRSARRRPPRACRAQLGSAGADLVVLDVELSDGSGLDLIPAVRAALPAARVVVLSGGDHLTVTDRADLVLLKTLDPTTVVVKLERLLAAR